MHRSSNPCPSGNKGPKYRKSRGGGSSFPTEKAKQVRRTPTYKVGYLACRVLKRQILRETDRMSPSMDMKPLSESVSPVVWTVLPIEVKMSPSPQGDTIFYLHTAHKLSVRRWRTTPWFNCFYGLRRFFIKGIEKVPNYINGVSLGHLFRVRTWNEWSGRVFLDMRWLYLEFFEKKTRWLFDDVTCEDGRLQLLYVNIERYTIGGVMALAWSIKGRPSREVQEGMFSYTSHLQHSFQ
ncbi:uncharacterized protein EDB91DRAFT_1336234 [Suillus paluster]|uniref:uncharacterized protein n=1 Tax=Suillus paluster TaxID=48578 RepID=UPI001B8778D4|nr:uncharacterized protein EDB91DRAFT_1336234 [Suillus paluster]KAG1741869.1 hypothetical protein EDB91DRAFT_1336234 [Suillus paluster]